MNTATNSPMSFLIFKHYMDKIKEEYKYFEVLYNIGMLDLVSKIISLDVCVELLEIMFKDEDHFLSEWIFERQFGEMDNTTTSDIYNTLIENYNKKE